MTVHKVHIIGIGDDGGEGLTSITKKIIAAFDLVLASATTLARVSGGKQRSKVSENLDDLVEQINAHDNENIVILGDGD